MELLLFGLPVCVIAATGVAAGLVIVKRPDTRARVRTRAQRLTARAEIALITNDIAHETRHAEDSEIVAFETIVHTLTELAIRQ